MAEYEEGLARVRVSGVRHSLREKSSAPKLNPNSAPPTFAGVVWWEIVVALLFAAVAALISWMWLTIDNAPLFEHSGRFIRNSVVTWLNMRDGLGLKPAAYPPLAYWVSCATYNVCGLSRQSALASQLLFYFPYVLACWWLGRQIGGRGGGLLVAVAAAGNLWFAVHLHGYFLEIALTALVACAWAFWLASDHFRRPIPTIMLGLTIGLGMLAKWVFVLFVGPLFIGSLGVALKEGKRSFGMALLGLMVLFVTLGAIYAGWGKEFWDFPRYYYLVSLNACLLGGFGSVWLIRRWGWNVGGGFSLAVSIGTLAAGWWYFLSIQELQVKAVGDFAQNNAASASVHMLNQSLITCYWLVPFLFVAGLFYGFYRHELRWFTLGVLGLIAPAFVFYASASVPIGVRYLLPSTVAVIVLAFAWMGRFSKVWKLALPVVCIVSALQLGGFLLPNTWNTASFLQTLRVENSAGLAVRTVPPPDPQSPPVDKLTTYMLEQLDETGESRFTAAIMPDACLDVDMLILEALLQGRLIDIEHYLPGRTHSIPKTSMILVIQGATPINLHAEGDWAKEYELMKTWDEGEWGTWQLYQHPYHVDMRPLPGSTSGPPRNAATVE